MFWASFRISSSFQMLLLSAPFSWNKFSKREFVRKMEFICIKIGGGGKGEEWNHMSEVKSFLSFSFWVYPSVCSLGLSVEAEVEEEFLDLDVLLLAISWGCWWRRRVGSATRGEMWLISQSFGIERTFKRFNQVGFNWILNFNLFQISF